MIAYLYVIPSVQRLAAWVVALRQLGSARGVDLCRRAFGPGQAQFPGKRPVRDPTLRRQRKLRTRCAVRGRVTRPA